MNYSSVNATEAELYLSKSSVLVIAGLKLYRPLRLTLPVEIFRHFFVTIVLAIHKWNCTCFTESAGVSWVAPTHAEVRETCDAVPTVQTLVRAT